MGGRAEVSWSDEGEIIVTLDPAFLGVPTVVLGGSSVPFDESGEVSLAMSGETPIHEAAVASSTSTAASLVEERRHLNSLLSSLSFPLWNLWG